MSQPLHLEVEINVRDRNWRRRLPDFQPLAERALNAALKGAGWPVRQPAGFSLLLTDDAEVQALNKAYRQKDKPTNVLSFPFHEAPLQLPPSKTPLLLGDMAFAYQTVSREAKVERKRFEAHFMHLVVHSCLHLLGIDHETSDADADAMERLEIEILAGLGYNNPYKDYSDER